jgi:glucose/arabinose dehydrogenase
VIIAEAMALPGIRRLVVLACALAGLALGSAGEAQALPSGFQESVAFSGLTNPTVVRFSPDGRVFIAEKSGLVKVFDSLADPTPTVFADLRTNVHNFWDRGLLGMALDPEFPADPYVYVLYAYDAAIGGQAPRWGAPGVTSDPCPNPPGATADGCVVSGRLSRLTAAGDTMTGPEQVLIEDWCQQYPSHSTGQLEFGADGALYVSGGDGASFNFVDYGQDGTPVNPCGDPPGGVGAALTPPTAEGGALRSQDLRTTSNPVSLDPASLDGTILRVDPDTGAALPNNPLAFSSDPNARRIVAHGLRNPFRLTVRPGTSEVWIGDVGWNTWEELNRIADPLGTVENFGWPCYEGNSTQNGYDGANLSICESLYAAGSGAVQAPAYTYNHGERVVAGESCPTGSSSVAGLAFYEGGAFPASYNDALFFTDYSRDCIWVMFKGTNGLPNPATRATFQPTAANPVSLTISPEGDLFYPDFDGGTIRRIRYFSSNQPPVASVQANPTSGSAPLDVGFDGTGSSDPESGALTYEWDLDGDGAFDDSTSSTPARTYAQQGTYLVRLRVTDPQGASDLASVSISVGNSAPTAVISTPSAGAVWSVGDTIAFSGSGNDPEQGSLPASALNWSLILHHCPSNCHTHPIQDFNGVASGSFSAPDHEYPSHLELRLTVTDGGGLQSTASVQLDPRTVPLTIESNQAGLQLALNSASATAPFSRTVIVGSSNSLSAPSPQAVGGTTYTFSSWSDSGAQTHNVTAPATPTTYRATFNAGAPPPPPAPGLVAAFGFDEGVGGSVADASGRGNGGVVAGAGWAAGGRFGSALSFDGVNDWVTVADAASLDLAAGMTLEAWVRPSGLGSVWRTVVLKETASYFAYALYGNTSGTPRPSAHVYIGGDRNTRGTAQLPVNAWSHLAATYDGAVLRLFVNGVQVSTRATTGAMAASSGPLRIGGNAVWPEWFQGLIDEVRVYDRALSAAEIQTDMNTPIG